MLQKLLCFIGCHRRYYERRIVLTQLVERASDCLFCGHVGSSQTYDLRFRAEQ